MKKILIIITVILSAQLLLAQSSNLFVLRSGGEKQSLNFGKLTYNKYHFVNNCEGIDSLICIGSGYELCEIDKNIIRKDKSRLNTYRLYNKAIKRTSKHIRKSNTSSGKFSFEAKGRKIIVIYNKANTLGEGEYQIEVV